MPDLTNEIEVVSDETGAKFKVFEYTSFVSFETLSEPARQLPGSKDLLLEDGSRLNFIDANTFKTLDGEVLRRIQPI